MTQLKDRNPWVLLLAILITCGAAAAFLTAIYINVTAGPAPEPTVTESGLKEYGDAMLMGGIQAAIYAHQKWLNEELLKGNLPDRIGLHPTNWEARAVQAWKEGPRK